MRIAVDAMGGDSGPEVVVPAAIDAVRCGEGDLEVVLVGREDRIRPLLAGRDATGVSVTHASEVIDMSESPLQAFRKKVDASVTVALRQMREGRVDAVVSAGNTGAVVAGSLVTLGRLHGVSRPAISTLWPNKKG
ncbi:MAG: phosphate acyltransferase, partial [Candidatus Krumholzibacteria bacterium]|nr:phosphate acyltransferase [Candidatus Krumholzibacteria bacterium]